MEEYEKLMKEMLSPEYTEFVRTNGRSQHSIISSLPFPGWKEPKPIIKAELEKFIEEFKKNPEAFKRDLPRW